MRELGWRTDSEKKVFSTPIFDISEMERTSHDGRHGKFVRLDSPDWVVAIPWFRRQDGVPCFVMEEQWRHGPACPNPAFMNNVQSFFLVEDIRKEGGQSLDPNEEIVVIEVPVEDVIRDMGQGLYDNGIMMMAIGFFLRYAEAHPELRRK